MAAFGHRLRDAWQTRGVVACFLWPVSLVYRLLVAARRLCYRFGWLPSVHPGRPVIVVGNVIAGGAGKTPVVIAVARHLRAAGLRPGIISRGYGRQATDCRRVTGDSAAAEVGDEPVLIARSLGGADGEAPVPVYVASQRVDAARALLANHPDTDVILCDDGLQHLALQRDIEVCVFNGDGIGNGLMLPAGPLREAWPRRVDFALYAGSPPPGLRDTVSIRVSRNLAPYGVRANGTRTALSELRGIPLHAVAAVARPEDFFTMLRAAGLTLAQQEALPDHYNFDSWQRLHIKGSTLVCTEKDAIKLWAFHPDALAIPLRLEIDPAFFLQLDARLTVLRQAAGPRLSSASA